MTDAPASAPTPEPTDSAPVDTTPATDVTTPEVAPDAEVTPVIDPATSDADPTAPVSDPASPPEATSVPVTPADASVSSPSPVEPTVPSEIGTPISSDSGLGSGSDSPDEPVSVEANSDNVASDNAVIDGSSGELSPNDPRLPEAEQPDPAVGDSSVVKDPQAATLADIAAVKENVPAGDERDAALTPLYDALVKQREDANQAIIDADEDRIEADEDQLAVDPATAADQKAQDDADEPESDTSAS